MSHLDQLEALIPLWGRVVVDVGCGTGGLVRALAHKGAHAIGIEACDAPLAVAEGHPRINGEHYAKGTGQALPLPDGAADVVVFIFSLHHVPIAQQRAALAEARRVLKPGGRLHVAEPLVTGTYFPLLRWVDDETEVRAAAQAALADAESLGLRAVADQAYDHIEDFADFEDFKRRAVLVDSARTRALERAEPHARHAFHAHGEVLENAVRFVQPVRLLHYEAA